MWRWRCVLIPARMPSGGRRRELHKLVDAARFGPGPVNDDSMRAPRRPCGERSDEAMTMGVRGVLRGALLRSDDRKGRAGEVVKKSQAETEGTELLWPPL